MSELKKNMDRSPLCNLSNKKMLHENNKMGAEKQLKSVKTKLFETPYKVEDEIKCTPSSLFEYTIDESKAVLEDDGNTIMAIPAIIPQEEVPMNYVDLCKAEYKHDLMEYIKAPASKLVIEESSIKVMV
jgi:hypothetical protein